MEMENEKNSDKPNPDELLKAVQKEEREKGLGKLKIFFGMSAGVGKTFSMLQEAHQRLSEGVNVAIGTVNTHHRIETEALVLEEALLQEPPSLFCGEYLRFQ